MRADAERILAQAQPHEPRLIAIMQRLLDGLAGDRV